MAVTWTTENKRGSLYLFDPAEVIVKPDLNGRYDVFDEQAERDMNELIQSILDDGQLEPVLVRQEAGQPVLAAGFRRWYAISEINKRKLTPEPMKIESRYVRCNEQEGFFLNWQENNKRKQTSPMDDAHHFARLEKWSFSIEQIAERLHITPAFVRDRLALLEAIPSVQAAVATGKIKPTAAKKIAKMRTEQQREIMKSSTNGHKISAKEVDAVSGKVSKPSFKAAYDFIAQFDGPGIEDETREVVRKILAFMDGKQ